MVLSGRDAALDLVGHPGIEIDLGTVEHFDTQAEGLADTEPDLARPDNLAEGLLGMIVTDIDPVVADGEAHVGAVDQDIQRVLVAVSSHPALRLAYAALDPHQHRFALAHSGQYGDDGGAT